MALTACEPCGCIPGNELKQTYQQNVRKTLCEILTAVGGGEAGAGFVNTTNVSPYVHTQPTVANVTSVTIVAANPDRHSITIQNNSAANIMINLAAGVLTGIVPTSTNLGIVLNAGGSWTSPPNAISTAAITAYQSSGGGINTISVMEQSVA